MTKELTRTRFVMIGGFLGAGKTTAIGRLAGHYIKQGFRIGLVTNDQAYDLVDTNSLRAQGFHVGEVPGACFCCKFEDLVETADRIGQEQFPDILITEPVGSCTDLVATVIEPLRHLHGDRYEIAPLAVLLKPEHGLKILRREPSVGFSPKAAYIFLKQIEEADVVAINKIDKLSVAERVELVQLVTERFPGTLVVAVSAQQGDGFEQLIDALDQPSPPHGDFMSVDYDVYADGEAELGWLNCTVNLRADQDNDFLLDKFAEDTVKRISRLLWDRDIEPAHLKVLVQDERGNAALANLVSSDAGVDLSMAAETSATRAELTINARVAACPEDLEQIVRQAVDSLSKQSCIEASLDRMQRFRPGRPVPTHRYSN